MIDLIIPVRVNIYLRTLEAKDAEELFALIRKNNTHLRQWLGWLDDDKSVEDVHSYIIGSRERLANREGFDFIIFENDKMIGGIALHPVDFAHKETSIMYWLNNESQGKGIMSDSLKVVIDYIFNVLKLNRVEIGCAIGNNRGSALPKKLGFTLEGVAPQANWLYDHFVDLEVYSLLAKEWKKH